MTVDLLLADARIASSADISEGSIAIDNGRIVAIGRRDWLPEAKRVIPMDGRTVLPGGIDGHMHLTENMAILAEPYETGTQAAAAGGVTTLLLMPWDTPTLDSLETLKYRQAYVAGRSYVDYNFHAGVTADTAAEAAVNIPALWDAGVAGIKVLMVSTDPLFPHLNDGQLLDVFEISARTGALIVVHAENAAILRRNKARLLAAGRKDPLAHEEYRSALSENEAVRRVSYLAEKTGAHVVVAHMSTAAGVVETSQARARGADVSAEVCPRNLFLSTVDLAERGSWVKTGPPVRSPAEVEAIWPMLGDGRVSVISSDHAAWTKEARLAGQDDIWVAYDGVPQVQESLPLLLDAVNAGRLTLEDVVRLTAYNPARVYGLWPRKGAILPGFDADLVVVDLERRMPLESSMLKSAVGYSAYENRVLTGWPVMTLVRGQIVMQDGEIVGSPRGQFIPRVAHRRQPHSIGGH